MFREESPQKTPALNEVFSSLASAVLFAERERGDDGTRTARSGRS